MCASKYARMHTKTARFLLYTVWPLRRSLKNGVRPGRHGNAAFHFVFDAKFFFLE